MGNTLAIYIFLLHVTLLERMEAAVCCSSDPHRRFKLGCTVCISSSWILFLDQDLMGGARQVYKYKPSSLQFILFPWQIIQRLTTLLLTQIHTHSPIGDASAWLITLFVHPEAARSERGKPLIRQDWDLRSLKLRGLASPESDPRPLGEIWSLLPSLLQIPLWVWMRCTVSRHRSVLFWSSCCALHFWQVPFFNTSLFSRLTLKTSHCFYLPLFKY